MDDVALAPRNADHGVIAVWVLSFVAALALGFLLPDEIRTTWIAIAFGGIVLVSFAVQLAYARPQGFITRVSASIGGALLLMGLVSAGFGLAALATPAG